MRIVLLRKLDVRYVSPVEALVLWPCLLLLLNHPCKIVTCPFRYVLRVFDVFSCFLVRLNPPFQFASALHSRVWMRDLAWSPNFGRLHTPPVTRKVADTSRIPTFTQGTQLVSWLHTTAASTSRLTPDAVLFSLPPDDGHNDARNMLS